MKECKKKNHVTEPLQLETFINENILCGVGTNGDLSWDDRISALNWYFELSEAFHQPKGDGYKLVLTCLRKYLDFKFIRENNKFRFQEELFDNRVEVLSDSGKNTYSYTNPNQGLKEILDGSKADIYYLLHEAEQDGIATRRCMSYVNSNRLHLTAVLIQLIERIVENLEQNPLKKYQEYGQVLRATYMTSEYADLDVFSLFEVLGYNKKKYYRIRNAAVSLISETLFGVLAGENGFANLYVDKDGIHVMDKLKK